MRQVPSGPPPVFVNWKQQMLLATDQIGIRNVTLPPNDVWRMVRDQFLDNDRTLNDAFSVAHPDVTQFISVIEAQSRECVRLINDISNRRATAPAHAPAQPAPAFDSDSDFEVDSDSDLDVSDPGSEASDGASVASRSPEY
ncbi:hypothetical protein F441_01155 [Phytophthora nicotianae CJ01A1]|uniref:Uncharacterized protein n=1 Tax=Phytophthora nicotianae CJ01A1 TaxID=1317063 RepID=W2XVT7_PHYNI|nr:hypothetical protein F441_01155 [Phytophthora nicotianae CJ01A1]